MKFLLSPKWVFGHILILALAVTFVALGFWQLDRWGERRLANSVNAARFESRAAVLGPLVAAAGNDLSSLEYRRAEATGVFVPAEEVLLRSQVRDSRAGFDVITPLLLDGGEVVLVDRGWVPLEFDTVPVTAASPLGGEVSVEGIIRLGHERAALGHDDFVAGQAATISRVDIEGLDPQVTGDLVPIYLQMVGEAGPTDLPIPASPPDFTDEGPHRDYALQWLGFALVAAIGYGFLIRRVIRRRSR